MCRCETGCNTKRCGCFTLNKRCSSDCKCENCQNQSSGSPSKGSPDSAKLERKVDKIGKTVDNLMRIASNLAAPRSNEIALQSDTMKTEKFLKQSEVSNILSLQVPSDDRSIVSHPINSLAIHPQHQVQSGVRQDVQIPEVFTFSNVYSLGMMGGPAALFQHLEQRCFYLVIGDENSRTYGFNYPGTQTEVLRVYVLGLPDFRVQVQVMSKNSEIFTDFINNFLSNYK